MRISMPEWNPFETYLLIAAVLAGIAGLVDPSKSSRIVQVLPTAVLIVWYSGILIGAILVLVGIHIRFLHRIYIELAGLTILGCISLGYTIVLMIFGGRPLSYPILITGFFAIAAITKWGFLYNLLRRARKKVECNE